MIIRCLVNVCEIIVFEDREIGRTGKLWKNYKSRFIEK